MATKLSILALVFSLFFISQVSSDSNKNEQTSHLSQALHVFTRGGERQLMDNMELDVNELVSRAPAPSPITSPLDCGGKCKNRCSLHSRQKVCLRACGTCCARCKCVPPGTSGNREMCGKCYTEMTTHGKRPKCP